MIPAEHRRSEDTDLKDEHAEDVEEPAEESWDRLGEGAVDIAADEQPPPVDGEVIVNAEHE